MDCSDEYQRIEEIEGYISLGRKIGKQTDNSKYRNDLAFSLRSLRLLRHHLKDELDAKNRLESYKSRVYSTLDSVIEELKELRGGRDFDIGDYKEATHREVWSYQRSFIWKARYASFRAKFASFFRSSKSKKWEKIQETYSKGSKAWENLLRVRYVEQALHQIICKELHDEEFEDARKAEEIRPVLEKRKGADENVDDIVYEILNRKEIVHFEIIDRIKDKIAPWL